jgi:hypothetical protein
VVSSPPLKHKEITYPSIPEPGQDVASLQATVLRLKEAVEMLTGQRGPPEVSTVGILQELRGFDSRVYELKEVDHGLARITQGVQTQVDDMFVEGQVVLSAEANPTGYKAYFGVYLKATADSVPGTERRAGMHLGLTNADGGVFALDVDKFIIRDAGSSAESSVFTYGSGVFTMTGNVTINGNLMVTNTITGAKLVDLTTPTTKVAYNAIGQFYQTSRSSFFHSSGSFDSVLTRSITGVTGGYALIVANVIATAAALGGTPSAWQLRIRRTDGGFTRTVNMNLHDLVDMTTTIVCFDPDASGNYTYSIDAKENGATNLTIPEFSVQVCKR